MTADITRGNTWHAAAEGATGMLHDGEKWVDKIGGEHKWREYLQQHPELKPEDVDDPGLKKMLLKRREKQEKEKRDNAAAQRRGGGRFRGLKAVQRRK